MILVIRNPLTIKMKAKFLSSCRIDFIYSLAFSPFLIPCFAENKSLSYINFFSKNALGPIFWICLIFTYFPNYKLYINLFSSKHLLKYSHFIIFWNIIIKFQTTNSYLNFLGFYFM